MEKSRYALIGHPLGHSLSPFIQARLFSLSGQDVSYTLEDLPPEELETALPALFGRVKGLNVTIPHKQAVIPYLSALKGRAELYRSVNTIALTAEGPVGYNTDAGGFLAALRDAGIPLGGRVALLGCGGVGRTFACEAALAGARIVCAVREEDLPAGEALGVYVRDLVPGAAFQRIPLSGLPAAAEREGFDLLINATPVGMYPRIGVSPVDDAVLRHTAAVFDAVYNPGETALLRMAAACGAKTAGGMPMLVWQAVEAHACWYGASFENGDIRRLITDAGEEMARSFG